MFARYLLVELISSHVYTATLNNNKQKSPYTFGYKRLSDYNYRYILKSVSTVSSKKVYILSKNIWYKIDNRNTRLCNKNLYFNNK